MLYLSSGLNIWDKCYFLPSGPNWVTGRKWWWQDFVKKTFSVQCKIFHWTIKTFPLETTNREDKKKLHFQWNKENRNLETWDGDLNPEDLLLLPRSHGLLVHKGKDSNPFMDLYHPSGFNGTSSVRENLPTVRVPVITIKIKNKTRRRI